MDAALRAAVRNRAGECCEYCQRRQVDSPLIPLQIEHVIPRKHGGNDDVDNLALACAECNLHKGPNLTGIDADSNQITPIFHPRMGRAFLLGRFADRWLNCRGSNDGAGAGLEFSRTIGCSSGDKSGLTPATSPSGRSIQSGNWNAL